MKRDLEKLMKELCVIRVSPDTDSEAKKYLEMLFELRQKDWNKTVETSSGASAAPTAFSSSPYFELPDK